MERRREDVGTWLDVKQLPVVGGEAGSASPSTIQLSLDPLPLSAGLRVKPSNDTIIHLRLRIFYSALDRCLWLAWRSYCAPPGSRRRHQRHSPIYVIASGDISTSQIMSTGDASRALGCIHPIKHAQRPPYSREPAVHDGPVMACLAWHARSREDVETNRSPAFQRCVMSPTVPVKARTAPGSSSIEGSLMITASW